MLSLKRHFRTVRSAHQAPRSFAGFTLSEIVIALAILGTMSAGCYIGFNSINAYAVTSRLYSEAQTAAQNEIDLILSKEPFDIRAAYISGTFAPSVNKVPIELMTTAELDILVNSGVSLPTAVPTPPAITSSYYPYYPYYRENGTGPIKKEAFIYQDPVTGSVLVKGTLTATITDAALSMNFITTNDLNTRKATVTVDYTFRGKAYSLSMGTLRTADQ